MTRFNVLLIVCDDLRPQLGAYNHSLMRTPHFDALAETGLLFERAYTIMIEKLGADDPKTNTVAKNLAEGTG